MKKSNLSFWAGVVVTLATLVGINTWNPNLFSKGGVYRKKLEKAFYDCDKNFVELKKQFDKNHRELKKEKTYSKLNDTFSKVAQLMAYARSDASRKIKPGTAPKIIHRALKRLKKAMNVYGPIESLLKERINLASSKVSVTERSLHNIILLELEAIKALTQKANRLLTNKGSSFSNSKLSELENELKVSRTLAEAAYMARVRRLRVQKWIKKGTKKTLASALRAIDKSQRELDLIIQPAMFKKGFKSNKSQMFLITQLHWEKRQLEKLKGKIHRLRKNRKKSKYNRPPSAQDWMNTPSPQKK